MKALAKGRFAAMSFRSPLPGQIGMGPALPAVEGGGAASISIPCGLGKACSGARAPPGCRPQPSIFNPWGTRLGGLSQGDPQGLRRGGWGSFRVGEGQGEERVRGNEPQETVTRSDRSGGRRASRGGWWSQLLIPYPCSLHCPALEPVPPRLETTALRLQPLGNQAGRLVSGRPSGPEERRAKILQGG